MVFYSASHCCGRPGPPTLCRVMRAFFSTPRSPQRRQTDYGNRLEGGTIGRRLIPPPFVEELPQPSVRIRLKGQANDRLRAVIQCEEALLEDEPAARGVGVAPEAGSPPARGQASRTNHA